MVSVSHLLPEEGGIKQSAKFPPHFWVSVMQCTAIMFKRRWFWFRQKLFKFWLCNLSGVWPWPGYWNFLSLRFNLSKMELITPFLFGCDGNSFGNMGNSVHSTVKEGMVLMMMASVILLTSGVSMRSHIRYRYTVCALVYILVSWRCCNKVAQVGYPRTTEIYFQSCRGWKSEIQVLAELASSEDSAVESTPCPSPHFWWLLAILRVLGLATPLKFCFWLYPVIFPPTCITVPISSVSSDHLFVKGNSHSPWI